MARLPTDREILRVVYDRYYSDFVQFNPDSPSRNMKIYVPIDLPAIAHAMRVDSELIFGRLHYHLEPKHGQPGGKTDIHFFMKKFQPTGGSAVEMHLVNFPLLESVLASLEYEHAKFRWATILSTASVLVAVAALAASVLIGLLAKSSHGSKQSTELLTPRPSPVSSLPERAPSNNQFNADSRKRRFAPLPLAG